MGLGIVLEIPPLDRILEIHGYRRGVDYILTSTLMFHLKTLHGNYLISWRIKYRNRDIVLLEIE